MGSSGKPRALRHSAQSGASQPRKSAQTFFASTAHMQPVTRRSPFMVPKAAWRTTPARCTRSGHRLNLAFRFMASWSTIKATSARPRFRVWYEIISWKMAEDLLRIDRAQRQSSGRRNGVSLNISRPACAGESASHWISLMFFEPDKGVAGPQH